MLPLDLAANLTVATLIGVAFGFVLERAGFGDSRILAAQFYLHNMRVLKVMFSAIVTAMLVVFLGVATGHVDYAALYVPPTYLWPGLLGGFLLGIGFLVGGFCPGTSMVATATLKLDGLLFVAGLAVGVVVFHATVPAFLEFWQRSGALGRVTLMDITGLSQGWIVLGVAAMAILAFAIASKVEAHYRHRRTARGPEGGA